MKKCINGEYVEISSQEIAEMQKTQQEYEKHKFDNMSYDEIVVALIRDKYTIDNELALHRQRDTKQKEFVEYNEYCEQCKIQAKEIIKERS